MNIIRNKDIAWQTVEGQVLIVTPDNSTIHILNSTGSEIWGFLEKTKRSIEEIVSYVCDEFEVEKERAFEEVSKFIAELSDKGIILVEE